jgi:hypothetical protein
MSGTNMMTNFTTEAVQARDKILNNDAFIDDNLNM